MYGLRDHLDRIASLDRPLLNDWNFANSLVAEQITIAAAGPVDIGYRWFADECHEALFLDETKVAEKYG